MPLYFMVLSTFVLTAVALIAGRKLALHHDFSDKPGGRKKHEKAVPPIGGLAVIPAFLIFSFLAGLDSVVPWPLAVGVLALMGMGAVDDAIGIKSQIKFAIIILTATFVVIFGETQIAQLGNLFGFGNVELGYFSKGFTILALALLMNAVNMIDGVDGLAGGFCALASASMMVICAVAGHWDYFAALAILTAAIGGFLVFNMRSPFRKRASIFLGDAGALCLGLILGWFCIRLSQGGAAPLAPATVIWIIAVPVMDAFALFLARSIRGLHPFNADRRHLHHRFLDAGISQGHTTAIILSLVVIFALIGYAAQIIGIPAFYLFYAWLAVFILHTACILHPKGYTLLTRFLRGRVRS